MEIIIKINNEYYFQDYENNYTKMEPLYTERNVWVKDHYEKKMVLEWHCWDVTDYELKDGKMIPIEED